MISCEGVVDDLHNVVPTLSYVGFKFNFGKFKFFDFNSSDLEFDHR